MSETRVHGTAPSIRDPAAASRTPAYRPDIDGLRAVAIVSVVSFHAASWLVPGGFAGVDVFFVISGYLICGIIDRDVGAGRFRFADFYARRARRILPALLALLLAVGVIGCVVFSARELWEFGIEAIGALFGVANVKFWLKNNYFADDSPVLPLLMTWSLGVEEQFYLFFPGLMLAIGRLTVRRRLLVLAGLTLLSFSVSVVGTARYPSASFYLLPARAWELGAGAMLAVWSADPVRAGPPSAWIGHAVGLAGLAAIVTALFMFNGSTPFPGYAALLPVLGTVMLLYAETGMVNRHLLASPPFVAIGLLSYSWYLWHWPLLALAHDVCDTAPSGWVMLSMACSSLVLAYGSWRWIERPFRRSRALPGRTLQRFGAALAGFAALAAVLIATRGLPERLPERVRVAAQLRAIGAGDCQLTFGVTRLADGSACMPSAGPSKIIALLGDSHANALGFGLAEVAERSGHRLWQVEKSACMPLLGVTTAYDGRRGFTSECAEFLDAAISRIVGDAAIDTVIIAAAWPADDDPRLNAMDGTQVGAPMAARAAIRSGLPPLVDRLQSAGKRVVLVGDVPHFGQFDPMRHVVNVGMPIRRQLNRLLDARPYADDRVPLDRLDRRFDDVRAYVRDLARQKQTLYVDIADQMCDAAGCLYEADGVPLFVDDTHLSVLGSRRLDWRLMGLGAAAAR